VHRFGRRRESGREFSDVWKRAEGDFMSARRSTPLTGSGTRRFALRSRRQAIR
jgi:hypothetical protein